MKYVDLKDALNECLETNFDAVNSNSPHISTLLQDQMQLGCFLCDCAYYFDMEGKHEQAMKYLKAGLLIQPNQFGLLANLGLQYWILGDKERGLYYTNKSLEEKPNDTDTLSNKANLLIDMGRYTEALEIADTLELLYPDDSGGYYCKGMVLVELALYDEALKKLLKAMELEPHNKKIPEFISEIYYEYLEDEEQAIKYLEIAEKMEAELPF